MKASRLWFIILGSIALGSIVSAQTSQDAFPRPTLVPEPASVAGVARPVVVLNGAWKFAVDPQGEFWSNAADVNSWRDIKIGEPIAGISRTKLGYKIKFLVPDEFRNKRVILRFDGVSGLAKVWVNGVPIREHWGAFMPWTADITPQVRVGEEAWLTVAIDDRAEGLAKALRGGGIQRDVKLMALPQNYLSRFHVATDLDPTYTDATLKVSISMAFNSGVGASVRFALKDPAGRNVVLKPDVLALSPSQSAQVIEIPIKSPMKWDAEHPNLYSLEASIVQGDEVVGTLRKNVGFRKLERQGNRVLVNGKEIKLRGLWDGNNVAVMRGANINHTRQKWATEAFLDECDRLGMYVLDEVPIDFALNGAQDDPRFADQYLSLIADLIERDRSHPSVIMWGTGNESWYGPNVAKTLRYASALDPERLTFFSWGNRVPAGEQPPFSVYSAHYANWDDDLGKAQIRLMSDIPILHDEYAHIAWYNRDTQRGDPNVHNFWGESISRFWESIFTTKGALGGDIFAFRYFDDRGEEKPEYWHIKKSYSPIRIDEKPLSNPGPASPLPIPIKNWFDHTKLNELRLDWSVGSESGSLVPPDVEPHAEGAVLLPARNWKSGETVNLKFFDRNAHLIDTYNLQIAPTEQTLSGFQGPAPRVTETTDELLVQGQDFSVKFSKRTGLIINGEHKGVQVIKAGPFLHLNGGRLGTWTFQKLTHAQEKDRVIVTIQGSSMPVGVTYRVSIDGKGLIVVNYSFTPIPQMVPPMVHNTQMRDVGGYKEIGVSLLLTGGVDRLQWKRRGLWSIYPDDHIGRNAGTAFREPRDPVRLRWSDEVRDRNLFGPYDIGGRGTRDFRSLKENIYSASAIVGKTGASLRAESNGEDAVRLEVVPSEEVLIDDSDPRLSYSGQWERLWAQTGSNKGTTTVGGDPGSSVELSFEGRGIAWTGASVRTSGQAGAEDAGLGRTEQAVGKADVYIDGQLVADNLDLSRPVERRYSDAWPPVLFSKEGLSDGRHTIKIVVRSSGVPIDVFQILRPDKIGDVRLVYANQWNYPDLSWGNYVKRPQITGTFYQNAIRVRLTGAGAQ